MHVHDLTRWRHEHRHPDVGDRGERNTRRVVVLTLGTMVLEIGAGHLFGSMALLADGWHMGTHAAALGIALMAYAYARRHQDNPAYSFGTGKVGVLGGFASAVVLFGVALLMAFESAARLIAPRVIRFEEAMAVALAGLAVNLVSAYWLQERHRHDHGTGIAPTAQAVHSHDHNLRAAYLHVLADALTSLLAILALLAGMLFGWNRLDPAMGIVGAVIISRWAWGLLHDTGRILLDRDLYPGLAGKIRSRIETDADNMVTDIHLWSGGAYQQIYVIVSLVTRDPRPPDYYKTLLRGVTGIGHLTVEVNPCRGDACRSDGDSARGEGKEEIGGQTIAN